VNVPAEQLGEDDAVPEAGDGEQLGSTLEEPHEQRLGDGHEAPRYLPAVQPQAMAPVSRAQPVHPPANAPLTYFRLGARPVVRVLSWVPA